MLLKNGVGGLRMKYVSFVFAIFTFFSYSFSEEYLIGVEDLPKERWKSSGVIDVIDNIYIILADETIMTQFTNSRVAYRIIDKNPRERNNENYYILFPIAENIQSISRVTQICTAYENFLIVRVKKENEEAFFSLKAERNFLGFDPYIFRDTIPEELKNINTLQYKDIIPEIVQRVNVDSLRSYVNKLQNFSTRKAASNSQDVCPWLVKKFKEHGADTVYTENVSKYGPNVIAIRYGTNHDPKRYCLIGGHLDAVMGGAPAAGADDNASGTAASLEAMRVLSGFQFENTIRCVAWNAEEVGLVGSGVYAKNAKNSNEQIIGGVINFDMIGYKKETPTLFIHYQTNVAGNAQFAQLFKKMADTYVNFNVSLVTSSQIMNASDHSSFWKQGYVAIFGIEGKAISGGSFHLCPNLHSPRDLLDNPGALNCSDLMANSTKAGVATLAQLAKPVGTPVQKLHANSPMKNSFVIVNNYDGTIKNIQFTVTQKYAPVKIVAYDVQGKYLATITNTLYPQGSYSVPWPKTYHTSGVYLIQCTQGNTTHSKKYVALK